MIVEAGSTDVTTYFVLRTASDGTATTGATVTDIDLQYCRNGAAPAAKADANDLGSTNAAHNDDGVYEIDSTDAPGLYRVDWPDAAFAAGVSEVILSVKLAGSFTEHLRVELSPPVILTTAAQQDIAQLLNVRPVWLVNKSGNDGNSGTSYDDAFLTIGQAVSSASSGDKIMIGPGTYSENVDASAKSLHYQGAGWTSIMTSDQAATLIVGVDSIVEDMKLANTKTTGAQAIYTGTPPAGADRVTIRRCWLVGNNKGVTFYASNGSLLEDTFIEGSEVGVGVTNASADTSCLRIRNCIIRTAGWDSCSSHAIQVQNAYCEIHNSILEADLASGSPWVASAIFVPAGGVAHVYNSLLIALSSDTGDAYTVRAIDSSTVSVGPGCKITSSAPSATAYDLFNGGTGRFTVAGTDYDKSKISGTIIDLDETAVDDGLENAIPGSPTADSINERLKAIDVLTEASGGGDLAAIKAKTDNQPSAIAKNVALSNFSFLMVDSVDHFSPETGLTVTAEISQDGGAFAGCANSATEIGNGVYKISFTQGEMNADVIVLKFTATGADQRTITVITDT